MKTGILTFHCSDNCGAMLQAVALKRALSVCGVQADIINFSPSYMTARHRLFPYFSGDSRPRALYCAMKDMCKKLPYAKGIRATQKNMAAFRSAYLTDTPVYRRPEELSALSYQLIFVGSDQIWNPEITLGIRPEYFGAYFLGASVAAYAPSIGSPRLDERWDEPMREALKSVSFLSVREAGSALYLNELTGREVSVVPDPTLLLTDNEWRRVFTGSGTSEHIFYYATAPSAALEACAQRLNRCWAMPIFSMNRISAEHIDMSTVGPGEFLSLIAEAACVVTNSFHGLVFSLMFHRPFLLEHHPRVGQRTRDFLASAGLESRVLRPDEPPEEAMRRPIDWDAVDKRLSKLRFVGLSYLRTVLREAKI